MSEGAIKFFATLTTIGLVGYGIFYWVSNNTGTFYMLIFGIVAVVAVLICLGLLRDRQVESRIFQGMPAEGPMKVNLEIAEIGSGKHRLYIDVKMTKKDWDALCKTGLVNHTLFEYGDDKHYVIANLLRIKKVDFTNLPDARIAKERLIGSLHALRSNIGAQHELARRPAERHESLEI